MINEVQEQLNTHGFEMIDQIGEGGYAKVYRVKWCQYPDKIFVAKIMDLQHDESNVKYMSYINEITTLQNLMHQNVIYIFKHFKSERYFYLILEYCPNGSLASFISRFGPLSIEGFKNTAYECLDAIYSCHTGGIVHLDIKPENILYDVHFRIKLCDFGLANFVFNGVNTRVGKKLGSLLYCSPERLSNQAYDPKKADIWSLGISFYVFITGCYPWRYKDMEDAVNHIKYSNVMFPPHVPNYICEFILSMLRKTPEERPSIAELLKSRVFASKSKKKSMIILPKMDKTSVTSSTLILSRVIKNPLVTRKTQTFLSGGESTQPRSSSMY